MAKSKVYEAAAAKIDRDKFYTSTEAVNLAKETGSTKFDSTVEVALKLGKGAVAEFGGAFEVPLALGLLELGLGGDAAHGRAPDEGGLRPPPAGDWRVRQGRGGADLPQPHRAAGVSLITRSVAASTALLE